MNIEIKSSANNVSIEFNDMSATAGILRTNARKGFFTSVSRSETHVTLLVQGLVSNVWRLSIAPTEDCLMVSKVDGLEVSSLDELEIALVSILDQNC